jgi:predicted nucleic acid-binding protein
MSVVNAGEVFYQLVRRLGLRQANLFWSQLERGTIPIRLVTATTARVERAARLKAQSRISYADAFAVTLAQELGIAIVTGDPEIRALTPAVAVEWLGS